MDLETRLLKTLNKPISAASPKSLYTALLKLSKEMSQEVPATTGNKKLYYISAEFLIGKLLGNNLINLGIYDEIDRILKEHGKSLAEVEKVEDEPSLGNGGLGRLAACFLDSIATLGYQGDGCGLNYHYGLFKQEFVNRKQAETPDRWLTDPSWETNTDIGFKVQLGNKIYQSRMYDLDVIGYGGGHNKLHLFDLDTVNNSIVRDGIDFDKTDIAHNLTLFLYPDDSDRNGQLLRIYQQYFMVSNAAQLIIREEKEKGHDLHHLDQYVAVQINDTHPTLIIPELMRLLMEEGIPMKEANGIIANTCAYTNHTILAEALEKWPLDYLQQVVPHLMPIIEGMDFAVSCAYNDPNVQIIDNEHRVHMARIDMHFGHSINGVAAIHTEILKHQELKPFYDIYPEKFNNKTNGITFRRWLVHCNHELSLYLDSVIGTDWHKDAANLERLMDHYDDEPVLNRLDEIKHHNKEELARMLMERENIKVDPDSIFCIQVKRMHEYKRQQMNALYAIYKYLNIKDGNIPPRPVTIILGGKAAPAYIMAKDIIHLILCLQQLIDSDPQVSPWLKIVMVRNYDVTKAEKLIPAADISEQISLASKEASGTSNMKFMLNGAVTLGTADGANVEIHDLVGDPNIYVFGRSSDEVIRLYQTSGYHAREYYERSQSIRRVIDFITGPELSAIGDPALLKAVQDNLINKDWFMTLLDLESYCQTKETMLYDYEDRERWKRMALVNIAKAGYFSSDRTIFEYNRDIWHLK